MVSLSVLAVFLLPALAKALWPIPRSMSTGNATLKLHSNFAIKVDIPNAPKDLLEAVSRTSDHLKTGRFERLVVGRGSVDAPLVADASELLSLVLSVSEGLPIKSIAQETTKRIDEKNESYTLTIPQKGEAVLKANTTLGLFRGLATFEQIWYDHAGTKYTLDAPMEIADTPAFVG